MNIFVTNKSPELSAQRLWLKPIRARKMITESMQMLVCAQIKYGMSEKIKRTDGGNYRIKMSVFSHPCTLWLYKDKGHVTWLIRHVKELYRLYDGDAFHNISSNIALLEKQFNEPIPDDIQFVNAAHKTTISFKHLTDVCLAYDLYLKAQGA